MKIVEFVEERQDEEEEEEEEEEEDVDSVDGGGAEEGEGAGPCRSSSSSSSRRTARRRKRKKKKKKKKQGMVMVGGDGNGGGGSSGNKVDAKRALVGASARILFYPTLLYNVFRNKIQPEFRWWDEVDQYVLLGAVPFPKDVPRLKQLGVGGVITLNEPYETLVPSSLYRAYGIEHLVIPTRDYLFAPSFVDISRAVDFIHKNASCGRTTYVHCKAGRGRSTTIVLCYLVEYKQMTPTAALEFVRSKRPRVLLAPSQWKAVQEYSRRQAASATYSPSGDAVLITKADLEGYHSSCDDYDDDDDGAIGKELAIVPRIKTRPVMARLSCLFDSLKVSGGCGPVTTRLSEARAC